MIIKRKQNIAELVTKPGVMPKANERETTTIEIYFCHSNEDLSTATMSMQITKFKPP